MYFLYSCPRRLLEFLPGTHHSHRCKSIECNQCLKLLRSSLQDYLTVIDITFSVLIVLQVKLLLYFISSQAVFAPAASSVKEITLTITIVKVFIRRPYCYYHLCNSLLFTFFLLPFFFVKKELQLTFSTTCVTTKSLALHY